MSVMKYVLGGPFVDLAVDALKAGAKSLNDASNKSLDALREEAMKQEIKMEFSQHQARVAQEIAIAKKIESALEVEIEELYDNSGKGNGGLDINAATQTGSLGVSSEHRRVSKRIFRFKDRANLNESFEQVLNEEVRG